MVSKLGCDEDRAVDGFATGVGAGTERVRRVVKDAIGLFLIVGFIIERRAVLAVIDGLIGIAEAGVDGIAVFVMANAGSATDTNVRTNLAHFVLVQIIDVQQLLCYIQSQCVDGCELAIVNTFTGHVAIIADAPDGFEVCCYHRDQLAER